MGAEATHGSYRVIAAALVVVAATGCTPKDHYLVVTNASTDTLVMVYDPTPRPPDGKTLEPGPRYRIEPGDSNAKPIVGTIGCLPPFQLTSAAGRTLIHVARGKICVDQEGVWNGESFKVRKYHDRHG